MNVAKLFSDTNITIASFTLIGIALVQFLGLVLYKVVVIVMCGRRMKTCCAHENERNDDW